MAVQGGEIGHQEDDAVTAGDQQAAALRQAILDRRTRGVQERRTPLRAIGARRLLAQLTANCRAGQPVRPAQSPQS